MLPIDIQPQQAASTTRPQPPLPALQPPAPNPQRDHKRPRTRSHERERTAIIAGRGAVLADAREDLEALGQQTGAILATSAPANGLFAGLPYALGISGGFASPFAAELLPQADAVLVVGASVNHWTTKHGALISDDATVIQIDSDARAIGRNYPVDIAVLGDARASIASSARGAANGAGPRQQASGPRSSPSRSRAAAGATSPTRTPAPTSGSTRAR